MLRQEDVNRVVEPLRRDVEATLGLLHAPIVDEEAQRIRDFVDDPAYFKARLIEDVQQRFHDEYVDTTWPACPRHPNHPLWFAADDCWWCTTDNVAIAPLGQLGRPGTSK